MFFAAVQHCLTAMNIDSDVDSQLDENTLAAHSELPRVIPKETAERAVNLTEYFQDQRKIYEDVSSDLNNTTDNKLHLQALHEQNHNNFKYHKIFIIYRESNHI